MPCLRSASTGLIGAAPAHDPPSASRPTTRLWSAPPPFPFCLQGEQGYLRVTRKGNDCGVASEPIYVNLNPAGGEA